MIWSILKLIFGCIFLLWGMITNAILWLIYFGYNSNMNTLFWTDREKKIQYYYVGFKSVFGWAFQIERLADSTFNFKDQPF